MSESSAQSCQCTCLRPKRCLQDRRNLHMQSLLYSLFKRRRRGLRRATDIHKGHYVDIHEPKSLIIGVAILVMSCLDAYFTLLLLQHGSVEINPLMKLLINIDVALFVKTKIAVTAFCIIFIITHKNFWLLKNRLKVHSLMSATMVMYFLLINYQIGMLISYN